MTYITSAANVQLKQLTKLIQQRKARVGAQKMVLEGVHLLQAFIEAGYAPMAVYVPQHRRHHPEVARLVDALPAPVVHEVANAALSKISSLSDADDLISVVAMPQNQDLPTQGDCVVLVSVQDPGNVGTLLRSALAAGIQQVLLSPDCADVYSPKVLRAGMGAHAQLRLFTGVDVAAWRAAYTDRVYATALSEHSLSVYDLDLRAPSAWLLGNEGSGLSAAMVALADQTVVVPMAAHTESLNVAMAATVCVFEQHRQRLLGHTPTML